MGLILRIVAFEAMFELRDRGVKLYRPMDSRRLWLSLLLQLDIAYKGAGGLLKGILRKAQKAVAYRQLGGVFIRRLAGQPLE